MNTNEIRQAAERVALGSVIDYDKIPDIALYMDQILTFFDDKLGSLRRQESDKLMTKTMINNYSKDKVFPPPVNKKYTKEHMLLLSMIFQMKGILSIGDIEKLLKLAGKSDAGICAFYNVFTEKQKESADRLMESLMSEDEEIGDEQLMELIVALTIDAGIKRMLAERLIDRLK